MTLYENQRFRYSVHFLLTLLRTVIIKPLLANRVVHGLGWVTQLMCRVRLWKMNRWITLLVNVLVGFSKQ